MEDAVTMPLHDNDYVRTPSGLILPETMAIAEARRQQRPKALDLFAGCGGASLGVIQAGFEVIGALEWEPVAVATYMTNLCRWGEVETHFRTKADRDRMEKMLAKEFNKSRNGLVQPLFAGSGWISGQPRSVPGVSHIFVGDVRKYTGREILDAMGLEVGELGLIIGGPPCQGFSVANKNRGPDDPRNNLVFEFARLVVEMQPKSVCMENVPGVLQMDTPDGMSVIDTFCRILEDGDIESVDRLKRVIAAQTGRVGFFGKKKRANAAPSKTRNRKAA